MIHDEQRTLALLHEPTVADLKPQPQSQGVTAHGKSVTGISFSATDQRKMVTVGGDAMVCVWCLLFFSYIM